MKKPRRLIDASRIDANQQTVYDYEAGKWCHIREIPTVSLDDMAPIEHMGDTLLIRLPDNEFEHLKRVLVSNNQHLGTEFYPVYEDTIQITRCAHCKWFSPNDDNPLYGRCEGMKHYAMATGEALPLYLSCRADHYCGYAERKE